MPRPPPAVVVVLASLLAAPASAAPDCEPLDEPELISLVLGGQSAVDRGNPDLQRGIVAEIRTRIPCLVFAPRARVLADYLVLEALTEFGDGGDWQRPLDAAIRIRPGVDRGVGGAHPISRHQPSDASGEGRPAPDGVRLYVDGEATTTLPPVGEMHLVQVTQDGLWRSQLTSDEAVADAWLTDPIKAPLALEPWGHLAVVAGIGGVVQRRGDGWPPSQGQHDYVPDRTWITAWPAIVARGGLDYGRLALEAELDAGLAALAQPVGSHAQAALGVRLGDLRVGAGAGIGATLWFSGTGDATLDGEPEYARTSEALQYGLVSASLRGDRSEAAVSFGAGATATRGTLRLGLARSLRGLETPLRLGLSGVAQHATLVQATDETAKPVTTITWRGGVELGLGL